ncbi:profilin-3 [Latimeria chalumnae]|uniref:profilin-3 n=1 Tax=Latimeria chalumnae TaxID=7897 RepID=UPI0003C0FCFF|nr:PREDICTED: profilin-3 [Latimeria chalumnae]|eukprot:XP_006010447.1 PREDICTED: profilin-3 [Latimeria chalumnae]
MADWKEYVNTILKDKNVEDAAIVGHIDNKCVWASKPGGNLAAISPQEVEVVVGQDRVSFLKTGMVLGGKKCSVIRDNLKVEHDGVMDIRTKGGDGRSICVGKTPKALIFIMGKKGVHGGALNKKVHEMIGYIKGKGS